MRWISKKSLRRLFWILPTIYLILLGVIAGCQKFLIFPGHHSQGKPWAQISSNVGGELVRLKTALGDSIVVLHGSARDAGSLPRVDAVDRPTILFFYGNAMSLIDCGGFLQGWQRLGANTLGVEYPGYGMSGGEPGEAAFYAAADAAYDELIRRGVRPEQIIVVGLSIGTGTAVDLASRRPVGGVALFAPFTSMDAMGRITIPWIPTRWIIAHHFRSDQKIGSLTCPILIARGSHDSIIPPAMSKQLADAATRAPVDLIEVDSDHNDLFAEAGPQLDAALKRLIDQVGRTGSGTTLHTGRFN